MKAGNTAVYTNDKNEFPIIDRSIERARKAHKLQRGDTTESTLTEQSVQST